MAQQMLNGFATLFVDFHEEQYALPVEGLLKAEQQIPVPDGMHCSS